MIGRAESLIGWGKMEIVFYKLINSQIKKTFVVYQFKILFLLGTKPYFLIAESQYRGNFQSPDIDCK